MRRGAALVLLAACGGSARGADEGRVPGAGMAIPVAPAASGASVCACGAEPSAARAAEPPPRVVDGCPEDMVPVAGFCIDRYEAPNVRGEIPYQLETAYDGEAWCSERGKRLCTEDEWLRACRGTRGRIYPYGNEHREGACNDDKPWILVHWKALAKWPRDPAIDEAIRLMQADMSGARAECVSEDGAYDLTGNVAEWVRRTSPPPHAGWDHVLKGCYWAGCFKEPRPNCEFTNGAHPGTFRTYEAGFRCCGRRAVEVSSPP